MCNGQEAKTCFAGYSGISGTLCYSGGGIVVALVVLVVLVVLVALGFIDGLVI